ncbi:hypothetical protein C8J57DRAFT_1371961 [Mycena rebaudengoi]|nr:hypothetical protein C8J57DRAFT_1371961 [Mycena rebaudengoi]
MISAILLILASTVLSTPAPGRKTMAPSAHHSNPVGAAYFMTNDPSGNYIVSATIAGDGNLALYEAIYAGGVGASGVMANPGIDPLFSQGSVKVSESRGFVAAVNAGSNSVAVFRIDHANPGRLSMIGSPVSSGGDFPQSLAINKEGSRVCVVNGGKTNGVSCFKYDDKKGLIPLKNTIRSLGLNQTTPPSGPANTPSHVIFSPNEQQLIVSVKMPPSGFLAMWDISSDGALSTKSHSFVGGALPFSLLNVPGKDAIIATDPSVGYQIFDFKSKSVSATAIPGQGAICWSVFSQKTDNFYLVDVGASIISEVHLGRSLNGTIVKQYSLGVDQPLDTDIAALQHNEYIYSLAANVTGITALAVNGQGRAQIHQRLELAGPAKEAGLPLHRGNLQGMATYVRKW